MALTLRHRVGQGLDTSLHGTGNLALHDTQNLSLGALTRRYWYHFTALAAIAVFMAIGMSAFKAVFWSGCWRSRSVISAPRPR